ncbi:MAG TPA: FCD domain-containing protein [Streptosporangiaceae bacterium]|nr:FCD domain-containing protein [Streptosporangiaceae bacterium]
MASSAAAARDDVPARPRPGPASKLAAQVADQIVGDVMAMGWPVGELLGSEANLLARYRVSRAVFREAVRLVEHQQVARTRRGPGGGLVITEPTVDAVIGAVVLYLYRVEARLDELLEARLVLEEIVTDLAPGRLEEADLTRMRSFLSGGDPDLATDSRALHALLASLTRNPVLELFVDVLSRVAMLYSTDWQSPGPAAGGETAHAHARIAEALIAGDSGLARRRMRKHLEAEGELLRRRRSARDLLPGDVVVLGEFSNGKRAEAVARRITLRIVGDRIPPGELVGTEKELIEQEGVSRAVLREAVRLLEHHQTARMRRGPGGGLIASEPSASAVTEVAAIYLARRGVSRSDLAELRTGVEVELVGLAAARIDAPGTACIRAAIEREPAVPGEEQDEAAGDLHAAVAGAARNRVLELVALVLIRLSALHRVERLAPGAREPTRAEVLRTHERIAAAVESGDRELARDRMRAHLDELATFMR